MAKIYLSGVGSVGWLYSDYDASLTSNWTELEWTGTELGKKDLFKTTVDYFNPFYTMQKEIQEHININNCKGVFINKSSDNVRATSSLFYEYFKITQSLLQD